MAHWPSSAGPCGPFCACCPVRHAVGLPLNSNVRRHTRMAAVLPPLTLGLNSGVVVHVSEVASGIACHCFCPSCDEPLVAKKGQLMQHHFAHQSGTECPGAQESAIHLAAKQAIARRRELELPAAYVSFQTSRSPLQVASVERAHFHEVSLEVGEDGMIFDALCKQVASSLVVEVRVTHAVDPAKQAKLRTSNRAAIEINLSLLPRDLPVSEIERLVIEGASLKHWLHHPASQSSLEAERLKGRKLPIKPYLLSRYVDQCPLWHTQFKGKPYANVSGHCMNCAHALEISFSREVVVCAAEAPDHAQLPLYSSDA
jgi:hypothetical protein